MSTHDKIPHSMKSIYFVSRAIRLWWANIKTKLKTNFFIVHDILLLIIIHQIIEMKCFAYWIFILYVFTLWHMYAHWNENGNAMYSSFTSSHVAVPIVLVSMNSRRNKRFNFGVALLHSSSVFIILWCN